MPFPEKRTDTIDFDTLRVCKTCGAEFHGRFCYRCGEKVIEPGEKSIKHFVSGLVNAFTGLDGKFLHSFKLMVAKPGQLSRNVADGIRVPYMNMLSFFFLANFFYFVFPLWDSFNSTLYVHMNWSAHREEATELVMKRVETEHTTLQLFSEKFQAQSTNLSKLLLIFIVIMFAVVLWIVNFRKKMYFMDHILLSLEYNAFHLFVNLLIITYFFMLVIKFAGLFHLDLRILLSDEPFTLVGWITSGYFLFRAQINFYKLRWYWAIPLTVLYITAFQYVVYFYRYMLFYLTMWTI